MREYMRNICQFELDNIALYMNGPILQRHVPISFS